MQMKRRNFIKFLVGGVAGIQLTPLPWKFTDDVAIWTQNWPWVPVPPVGAVTKEKTVCSLCRGACGIEVRKIDNRAVKIEGRSDYPVNPGGICPLGMGGLQLLYNESIRFTSPMKRVGPRGSGVFMDISWDEALDILSGRISKLRKKGHPEALAAIDGNPNESTMALMVERLLKAVGSPNYVSMPSVGDTCSMVNYLQQGTGEMMAYDLENADCILSFGSGLLEGWGSPGRVLNAWGLWHDAHAKEKAVIIQVEARASNTASKADFWITPKPGTEAALALGIAHVLIKDRLCNVSFIENYCFGYHDWKSLDGQEHKGFKSMVLDEYSPQQVAGITGLQADKIKSLAHEFGKAKAPIAICGKGKGSLNGSLYEFMAIQSLNALVGNINKPGGVLVHEAMPLSDLQKLKNDQISLRGLKKQRLDQAGTSKYPFTNSLINNFLDAILKRHQSPVDTLLVFKANPVFTLPDTTACYKALKKIPFIVSFSPFKDETALMADLILPDHTYLEKMDDLVCPPGLQYPFYGLTKSVVDPVYNTENTGDAIIRLAKKIGGSVAESFQWPEYEDVLKTRASGLYSNGKGLVGYDASHPVWKMQKAGNRAAPDYSTFEEMWEAIKTGGFWFTAKHNYQNYSSIFKTPSKKFEFFSLRIKSAIDIAAKQKPLKKVLKDLGVAKNADEACMPHYSKDESSQDSTEYPLFMMPYEMINLASEWAPNPPFSNKTLLDNQLRNDESFTDINPQTAKANDLKQGDRVIIKSLAGRIKVRVNITEGAMPGIVYLPLGLGHTAYDEFSKGKGVNPNDIITTNRDPVSGQIVWWNTAVKLIKV